MSDPAVITGDFSTFRHVQGRKVLQIVIEVPAEAAGAVFAKLGMPGSGEGIPVAVARLQTSLEPIAKPEPTKERRPFTDMPHSQQAALRCNEPDFHLFIEKVHGDVLEGRPLFKSNSDAAAYAVRAICHVASRGEITTDPAAKRRWEALEAEYYAWQRGMR